ncbi:phage tail protein [Rummeliibacillus stabekisii]|uniref:Phage tail protein n=1 Tax=Rummeliibacillus stabekisii TaxID=241244 RepID=A0A143HC46_9BACL|nr:phage tail protein [Rummeliibacillus stabekisii]AMW99314.1 hypothetical protein ATY39_07445 [Rummeliibacillus stabekisii]
MIEQTITIDQRTVKNVQKRLKGIERKAPNAISNALNRTISNLATNMGREVRAVYSVKASDIKSTLIKRIAKPNALNASIKSKGKVLGLDQFKVSPKTVQPLRKKPIKVAVKKGGLKPIPKAFVGNVSGIKVFERVSKERLPIRRLYGPSVPQMLKNVGVQGKLRDQANSKFRERLDHEINRLIERSKA